MNNTHKIKWYQLVFEQLQPLHIGKLNYGVIAETEIFIPGQTIWGALTKSYNLLNKTDLNNNQNLFSTITCFFPSFDGKDILAPSFKDGLLYLGENITEDEFKFAFLDTVVSTAIIPLARSALDESLHEIDFLLPRPKNELPEKNIYKETALKWIGLVGIEENNSAIDNFCQEDKLRISIGGEIKYGAGLLRLKTVKKIDTQELEKWNLNEKGELFINNTTKNYLRNFVQITPETEIKWIGKIVPLAEFDFTSNTPKIKEASFYISIGSNIYTETDHNHIIDKYRLFKGKFRLLNSSQS